MRLLGTPRTHPRELGAAASAREPRFLHRSIAQQFAVQILKGELPEGYMFPSENEFSAQLGVSRSALREAFRVLTAKGLVRGRPRTGTRVCPRRAWSLLDPELMAWHSEAEPSDQFMRHLFELRIIVEPAAAALAAKRRTRLHILEMAAALDGMSSKASIPAQQQFHISMLEASGNDAVIALSSSIAAAINQPASSDTIAAHRALYDAIVAGNAPRAERTMIELIRLAASDAAILLDEKTPP